MVIAILEEYLDRSEKKITWTEVAKKIGLTISALSHIKNGKIEPNFISALNLAKFVAELSGKNDYVDVFSDLCLTFERPKNIKCAFEFLASHGKLDHLEKLIDVVKKKYNSRDLNDWEEIYSILLMYKRNPKDFSYIHRLRAYSPKQLETKILSVLLEIYYLYVQQEYNSIFTLSESIEGCLDHIKDPYIKSSYSHRLFQMLAYAYLYRFDKPEKARHYAQKIISNNFCADLAVDSYYIMGMSFFFEDCDKCLAYLNKYVELLEQRGGYDLADSIKKNDIPFVQAHWGRPQSFEENVALSEKAHYEAKWGNKEIALRLIEECLVLEGVSPFKLYYKALATGEANLFLESLIIFSKKGNKFYAKLPYEYLKNHPSLGNAARLLLDI
jgi:transcriptional regulator with XRE-family HTH domain